eukprot:TRINITY_DN1417_c0_g1_i1.p1 TRINITY_DN1417_c0_g1~~TRINITY_DN1417_c0_g1_i1.p1  ORF type:complete len:125 (-),score=31.20 TRINITY_DN1417_c0_g1_i1:33-407(-)
MAAEVEGVFIWHAQCWDDRGDESTHPDPFGSGRVGFTKRINHYDAHKKYQGDARKNEKLRIIAGGPLVSDDGSVMLGSGFVLEGTKETIETFLHEDPFFLNGVWIDVKFSRYVPVGGIQPVPKL